MYALMFALSAPDFLPEARTGINLPMKWFDGRKGGSQRGRFGGVTHLTFTNVVACVLFETSSGSLALI